MSNEDWLENLKKDDKVALNGSDGEWYIFPVERITSKFIFVNGSKFRKTSGIMVSNSSFKPQWLEEPTEIICQAVMHRRMKNKLKTMDIDSLDYQSTKALYEFCKELKVL